MPKVILIPDSFKGTMSSAEICRIMADAVRRHRPAAEVTALPVADGGEGSVDAFLAAAGGSRVAAEVTGPFLGERITAHYGRLDDATAVIEMAAAAGLRLVTFDRDFHRFALERVLVLNNSDHNKETP